MIFHIYKKEKKMFSNKINQRTLNKFALALKNLILAKLSYMSADEKRIYLIVLLSKLQIAITITM